MRVEHIIKFLNDMALIADEDRKRKNAKGESATGMVLREAIALLRTHPDAQPNEPLTEARLKEMDGKAVFAIPKRQVAGYMGIVAASEKSIICRGGFIPFSLFKAIYRRPPKEE